MKAAAAALRRLRREGDIAWQARLLFNRGALHLDRGELDAAEQDLRKAHTLYQKLGAQAAAADAAVGLAVVALLRGDVVACLEGIENVTAALPAGVVSISLDQWYIAALTEARLLPEAAAAVERYIDACSRSGRRDYVASAWLDAAKIATLAGDTASARAVAVRALRSFAARGKEVNAALAKVIRLRAEVVVGDVRRHSIRTAHEAAAAFDAAGWRVDSLRAHMLAARIALDVGAGADAVRELEHARALRTCGTVADRIELCHVEALLRLADGNDADAERLLTRGLRLLDDHRAVLGAAELRATASGIGSELSTTGLRIAVASRDVAKILAWAERVRGNSLRLPLVRPPTDRRLKTQQTELRRVVRKIREAEARGESIRGLTSRQIELESAIRARTRIVRGEGAIAEAARPRDTAKALGDRALVEYVELDGVLRAVTIARGRTMLHELGPVEAETELEWLRFALGKLARGGNSPAQRAAHLANAQAAAAALDRLLVAPLLSALGDSPLIVVPTGPLHALPWGALPSLCGRPVVVAPSVSLWLDLVRQPRSRRRRTTLIAGPGLRHASAEVRDLAGALPAATLLRGRNATASAAMDALDGARLAHVACHGHFRADSPLFSSLELADGPLTMLDIQGLKRAPEVLVLSACDVALSERHPGDELLGLAAALLAMRTRTIIASVVPVPDAASRRLMLAFHHELAKGTPAAVALARAQSGLRRNSEPLAGFVCLGTG
jgi:hypothetical protein